jgi:hypothetical protein
MKRYARNTILRLLVSAGLCLSFLWPAKPQTARSSDIALLVHPDTPVDNLSLADVRKVFLGERQYWTTKLPVELYLRAPVSHERGVVLRVIYQMSEAQYRQYWIAKILRAEAVSPPKTVSSNDAAMELVTGIPGAIVFMDARDVRTGPKVLRVDGHFPGDPGYPLR